MRPRTASVMLQMSFALPILDWDRLHRSLPNASFAPVSPFPSKTNPVFFNMNCWPGSFLAPNLHQPTFVRQLSDTHTHALSFRAASHHTLLCSSLPSFSAPLLLLPRHKQTRSLFRTLSFFPSTPLLLVYFRLLDHKHCVNTALDP